MRRCQKVDKTEMDKTEVIYISDEEIHQYISAHKPSEGTVGVPGTSNMHAI